MSNQNGTPRSGVVLRLRWWEYEWVAPPILRPVGTDPDDPVNVTVTDVLNYFAKCPRCGYSANASATAKTFRDGAVETTILPTCGLPCGWQGVPRTSREAPPRDRRLDRR